ncbi:MAG: hypothetical protein WCI55_15470 [Armatimonadota bacterium]
MPKISKSSNEWFFRQKPPGDPKSGGVDNYSLPSTIDTFVREVVQNVNDQRVKDTVEVEFILADLSGDQLQKLLDLIGWDAGLKDHLEAVKLQDSHLSMSVSRALECVQKGRPVRMMLVRDLDAWGLEGDEEESGNFSMLCRDHLITDESTKKMKGGSYGLGKSVLWAFSEASTVLFSSLPLSRKNSKKTEDFRFFGRSYLPSHKIAQVWHNPDGFFGENRENPLGNWVSSVRGDQAESIVAGTPLEREPGRTGTSILIPFFGIPTSDKEMKLADLKLETMEAVQRWFWPALDSGKLKASICISGEDPTRVDSPSWAEPFRRAVQNSESVEILINEGETIQRKLAVRVPKLKNRKDQPDADSQALLCMTRISANELEEMPQGIARSIAMMRGAEMVVRYSTQGVPVIGPDFVAVLQAGTILGASAEDVALESFLRDSEPPAHDRWDSSSQKLVDKYRGGSKVLTDFLNRVASTVKDLLGTKSSSKDEPKKLAELLGKKKQGGGREKRVERFQMVNSEIDRSKRDQIVAKMTFKRNSGDGKWKAIATVVLLEETGKRSPLLLDEQSLIIESIKPVVSEFEDVENGGSRCVLTIPPGCPEITISITALVAGSKIARMAMASARVEYFDQSKEIS